MRVLVVAQPIVKRIWSDPRFLIAWDTVQTFLRAPDRPMHVYLLLEETFKERFRERVPEDPKGLTVVWEPEKRKYPQPYRFYMVDAPTLNEHFHRRHGLKPVDMAIVYEPESVPYVKPILSDLAHTLNDETSIAVPVFVQDTRGTYPRIQHLVVQHILDLPIGLSRAWGFMQGYPVFPLAREAEDISKEWEQCLSPGLIRHMKARTLVVPYYLHDHLFALADQRTEQTPPAVMFAGRMSSNKNLPWLKTILLGVQAKTGCDVLLRSSSAQMQSNRVRSFLNTFKSGAKIGLTREDFWAELHTAHVAVCASTFESFGTSFLEQAAAGQCVILPKAQNKKVTWNYAWVDTMWPSWYPWRYETPEEAVELASYLLKNYWTEEVQLTLARVRAWLVETFGEGAYRKAFFDHLQKIEEGKIVGMSPESKPHFRVTPAQKRILAKTVMQFRGKNVNLGTLLRWLHKTYKPYAADHRVRTANRQHPGNYEFYRTLLSWGLVDSHTTAVPTFTIPAKWKSPVPLEGSDDGQEDEE